MVPHMQKVDSQMGTTDRKYLKWEQEGVNKDFRAQVGGLRNITVPAMEGVLNGVTVVLASGYLGQI